MVGFLLTGHGEFARGLYSALEMIAGPQDQFAVVTFTNEDAGSYPANVEGALDTLFGSCDSVVAFVDLMGGTPFNTAMMASAERPGIEVVTGTNLPMLIECASERSPRSTAEELVATALEIGAMGIAHKRLEAKVEDADDSFEDEGI